MIQIDRLIVISRLFVGFVFIYHGLVPKILFPSDVEIGMVDAHEFSMDTSLIILLGGAIEVVLGLLIFILYKARWPLYIAMIALSVLLVDVAMYSPHLLVEAFNPVTLNIGLIILCWVSLLKKNNEY